MGFLIVILSISVWLSSTTVSSSVILSEVYGNDLLTYSSSSEQELFYVNGVSVNKVSFCKALRFHNAIKFFSGPNLENQRGLDTNPCGLDVFLADQRAGRKVLLGSEKKHSESSGPDERGHLRVKKHDSRFSINPKTMSMAVPGMFILSCLLFPCFRSRRKETSREVLTRAPISTDSIPSKEVISASEKIPGSPHLVPGSPLRAPGSPHRVPATHSRVPPSPSRFSISPQLSEIGSVHLTMNQVIIATQNFSSSLKIGEGGFGTVYRAQLQDGQVVAIKRARKVWTCEHINNLQAEFSSEVGLLAKIEHRNLVRLLGYLDKGHERIIITEHVPNGNLREHLDGQHGKILDFNQRLEISIDIAHALTYLHLYAEKQIIHRDVKSSNILLTESFRAKVADFGFARLGMENNDTHIVTKVKGTAGYLDPEYLRTYQLTPMSDVYSFGILMIEILTGRRPLESRRAVDERVTVRWAFQKYTEGNVVELLDPLMNEVVDFGILSKMFDLAFECAAPTRRDRPNMKEVGEKLWEIRKDYLKSVRRG